MYANTLENKIMRKLFDLTMRLEPENLYADGELSPREAKALERKLLAEYAALEKQLGRKVSESEILNWYTSLPKTIGV